MAEKFLPFTHLVFVLGLALLYSIHLNTKPMVTAGGAAAATSTSKRFAILRASHDRSYGEPIYSMSELPESLSQCLTSRWQAGPDWCKGTVCKLRTETYCTSDCEQLKNEVQQEEEKLKLGKEQLLKLGIIVEKQLRVPPTLFRVGTIVSSRRNVREGTYQYPPVNEMLEWVEDCGWALHSASSAMAGGGEARHRHNRQLVPHKEMYVFARPKL